MLPPPGPAAVFLPDQAFWRIKALVIERTGHFFYTDKDTLLWERLRVRMRQTGSGSCAEYLDRLTAPGTADAEWVALEAQVTIGETFFFRYAEQFEALRERILPAIIQRNAERRHIRIWSAGCATGPEPYSVAILLRRLLGDAINAWHVSITGSDISETSLAAARQGTYGAWALRGLTRQEIEQDFVRAEDGRNWVLRPRHRAMVRFQRHNLLSLLDRNAPLELVDFDLILCRNVLIYFHPEQLEPLVRALSGRLVAGGWLLLGHAEASTAFDHFLAPVNLPGTLAYRLRPAGIQAEAAPTTAWAPEPAAALPGSPPIVGRPDALPVSDPLAAATSPSVTIRSATGPSPTGASVIGPSVIGPSVIGPSLIGPSATAPSVTSPSAGLRLRNGLSGDAPSGNILPANARAGRLPAAGNLLDDIRSHADRGDLPAAAEACAHALAAAPTMPSLHFYDGLLAQAQDSPDRAEAAFRRAIYLYNDFAMAHYHLGLLLIGRGRTAPGRRAIATAARICAALPEDSVLPEGDGLTAGGLRDLARAGLATTPGAGG